ncbi:hypothetical protein VTN96DRAFT_10268 [Rasamsonia emersonii]
MAWQKNILPLLMLLHLSTFAFGFDLRHAPRYANSSSAISFSRSSRSSTSPVYHSSRSAATTLSSVPVPSSAHSSSTGPSRSIKSSAAAGQSKYTPSSSSKTVHDVSKSTPQSHTSGASRETIPGTIRETTSKATTGTTSEITPGTTAETTSSSAAIIAASLTSTITSPPSGFSTVYVTNSQWTANTLVTTTDAHGQHTIVPVLWHHGGGIELWGLPKLPKVAFKLPGLPEFCLFSCGSGSEPGVPVVEGGGNPDDSEPKNSEPHNSEPTTEESSTKTTSHTSSTTSTSCSQHAVTDTYVSCTTATSGVSTICKTSYSTITGCSVTGTATTTFASCSSGGTASGCPTLETDPLTEIDMLWADDDEDITTPASTTSRSSETTTRQQSSSSTLSHSQHSGSSSPAASPRLTTASKTTTTHVTSKASTSTHAASSTHMQSSTHSQSSTHTESSKHTEVSTHTESPTLTDHPTHTITTTHHSYTYTNLVDGNIYACESSSVGNGDGFPYTVCEGSSTKVGTDTAFPKPTPSYQDGTCRLHIIEASESAYETFFAGLYVYDGGNKQLKNQTWQKRNWGDTLTIRSTDSKLPYDVSATFVKGEYVTIGKEKRVAPPPIKPGIMAFEKWPIDIAYGPTKWSSSDQDESKLPNCQVGGWDNGNFVDWLEAVETFGMVQQVPNRQMDCHFRC